MTITTTAATTTTTTTVSTATTTATATTTTTAPTSTTTTMTRHLPTGIHLTAGPREGGAGGAGQGGRALHPEDLDQQGLLHQLHLLRQAGRRLS